MKPLRRKDIPAGATITIVALVLLVGVVKGREAPDAPSPALEQAVTPPRPTPTGEPPDPAAEIDLDRLRRPKREGAVQDLFPGRPLIVPAPVTVVIAPPARPFIPPAPTAPPLPFKYLGRIADSDSLIVFLEKGQETFSAGAGDTIEDIYSVEKISESTIEFVYRPLGTRQVLSIPVQK